MRIRICVDIVRSERYRSGSKVAAKGGTMKGARIMARPGVAIAVSVLVLGLPAAASAGAARHALVTEVHVTFTDSTLLVRANNPYPGPATIFVVNRGHKLHVLTIKGPGMRSARTQRVAPGSRVSLDLKLLTGAYQLMDPVLGKSMVRWLVVHPSNLVPGTTITPPKQAPTTAIVPGGMDCDL
jgi:hypothetical protein